MRHSTTKLVPCIAVLLGLAVGSKAQPQQEPSKPEYRWHQMWPAGPYSSVNTATGILTTTIPLFSLSGPGGTSIDIAVTHLSSSSGLDSSLMPIAKRWRYSYDDWIWDTAPSPSSFANVSLNGALGDSSAWGYVNGYYRKPGTRDDLSRVSNNGFKYVVTHKDQTTSKYDYIYSAVSQQYINFLTSIEDTFGNTVTVEYDPGTKRPVKITDASGVRWVELEWRTTAPIVLKWVKLVYPGGSRQWDFQVNLTNRQLEKITFPAPEGTTRPTIEFDYSTDGKANITHIKDLNGNHWYYEYTTFGIERVILSIDDPFSPTDTTFSYASSIPEQTRTTTITNQLGRQWKHVYRTISLQDVPPLPIYRVVDPQVTGDPAPFQAEFTWNYNDITLTQYKDRRGFVWTYTYDANNRGNLLTERNPDPRGAVITHLYDPTTHRRLRTIDAEGRRVVYEYHPTTHALIRETVDPISDPYDPNYNNPDGLNLVKQYTYYTNGDLMEVFVGNDPPTTYSNYDSYGNAWRVTNPLGKQWNYTFDALNNKLTESPPAPRGTTTFQYDNWNRVQVVTHPDASTIAYDYDFNSNLLRVTDENGHNVDYEYDSLNRVKKIIQKTSATETLTTEFGYDNVGNKIWAKNPRLYVTDYEYDERNNLKKITYPDNTTRQFHYDGNGNRDWRKDGLNAQTTYVYDEVNRLKKIDYPSGTTEDVDFTYDKNGLRLTMDDETGLYVWTYNGANLVETSFQPLANKTLTYTYDANGRKRTLTLDGQTWTYNYTATDKVDFITQTIGAPTPADFDYWDNDLLKKKTLGNGMAAEYYYDNRDRVQEIHHFAPGTLSPEFIVEYDYDPASNVIEYRENTIGVVAVPTTVYGYDWANRLTTEVRTQSPSDYSIEYDYDKNGNRERVKRQGVWFNYSHNANDEINSGDGFTFSNYNNNGSPGTISQSGGPTLTLTYNQENRLKKITYSNGAPQNEFLYNGDGLRVQKKVGAGTPTVFIYDGSTVIAEATPSGTITAWYLPGISEYRPGSSFTGYYRENGIGSTLELRNAGGGLESKYLYDAYGVTYTQQQNQSTPYRFVGRHGYYSEDESGLVLLGARYYMPKLGRFVTQDPIGHEAGLNIYQYASNNPLRLIDPSGLQGVPWWKFEFTWEGTWEGLKTSAAALGSVLSFGLWDGGEYKHAPGFAASQISWSVAEVAVGGIAGLAKSGAKAAGGVSVYVGKDAQGVIRYIGQSVNVARRAGEHARNMPHIRIEAVHGLERLTRAQARSVEQVLIEYYGLGKNGGQLINKINSIAKTNPAYGNAMREGVRILRKIGYPGF